MNKNRHKMCRFSTPAAGAEIASDNASRVHLLTGEGLDEDLHGCVLLFDLQ